MSTSASDVLSAAGTPFCPSCGSILVLPDYDPIKCGVCDFHTSYADLHLPVRPATSTSAPRLASDGGGPHPPPLSASPSPSPTARAAFSLAHAR